MARVRARARDDLPPRGLPHRRPPRSLLPPCAASIALMTTSVDTPATASTPWYRQASEVAPLGFSAKARSPR